MSATQAKTLAQRIVATHKFAPSIAEILEEWRQMRRDMNRHVYTAPVFIGKMSPEAAQKIREAKQRIHENQSAGIGPVSPELVQFARQFSRKSVKQRSSETGWKS